MFNVIKCKHDYVVINRDYNYLNEGGHKWYTLWEKRHETFRFAPATQKVCVKCGECVDEVKIAKEYFRNKEIKDQEFRKAALEKRELALKLWNARKEQ